MADEVIGGFTVTPDDLEAARLANLAAMQALIPPAPNLTGFALKGDIPSPAASAPPAVGDANLKGSAPRFALEDHTHVSSVFKAVRSTTDTGAVVAWTYPVGFFAAAPVIELTVEDSSAQDMTAKILTNTKDGGSAKIIASLQLPTITPLSGGLSLISGVVTSTNVALAQVSGFNVFGGAVPVGTKLHVHAGRATVVPT